MSAELKTLNPTTLTKEEIEVITFHVINHVKELWDKPMSGKEAYTWLGVSKSKFYALVSQGAIKGHRLAPDSDETFLRSEIISSIKNK